MNDIYLKKYNMEFTEEEKDLLKKLSLIIRSYGYDEAYMMIQMYPDDAQYVHSLKGIGGQGRLIEYPPRYETILEKFYNDTEFLWSIFDDVDDFFYGEVEIHINAKDKELSINANYNYYDTDCASNEYTFDEYFADRDEIEDLKEYFEKMKSLGYEEGKIDFSGGGDNGYIDDPIYLDGEVTETTPEFILDLCYDLLQKSHGGWELDEGSQGSFILEFNNNIIRLEYCANIEENQDIDVDFPIIKF